MRSPDGEEFIHLGEYLEIEKPSRLVFTHRWERNHLEPQSRHEDHAVILTKSGATTQTVFLHVGLAAEDWPAGTGSGWTALRESGEARRVESKS